MRPELLLAAARPLHWTKNALLCLPALAAHRIDELGVWMALVPALVAFSLAASGVYLLNDVCDREADAAHPRRRRRPVASGALAPSVALAWALGLGLLAAAVSVACPAGVRWWLAAYVAGGVGYALWARRVLVLDIVALSALYVVRVLAGAAAIAVAPSFWLLGFTLFMAFSLAMAKRCAALAAAPLPGGDGRPYRAGDLPWLGAIGIATALAGLTVLALYLDSAAAAVLYRHPLWLWPMLPLLLAWITRLWLLAGRGVLADDPLAFAVRDVASWLVAAGLAVTAWAAS